MSDITFNKLYLYDHIRELLVSDYALCNYSGDNGPMYKQPIIVHKGVDNKLHFRALGPDRKPVNLSCNQQVYARITDPENNKIILEKLCTTGPATGMITVVLTSGDLVDIHAGKFSVAFIRTENFIAGVPDQYIEKPIYSDMYGNIAIELEVTEQALKMPQKEVVILPGDWTPDMYVPVSGPIVNSFYSKRIPAGRVLNHKDAVHSFSTYTENFTGRLEIWGSLEESAEPYQNHYRWFKIHPSTMSTDVEFFGYTGTQAWTFSANFMWLKFRYFPSTEVLDPGVIKKLIVRV